MDDLISRQAVMDLYMKWRPYMAIRLYEFEKELKKLPPVKPEQKIGRWIITGDVDAYYDLPSYECSKCKHWSLEDGNYCPNCGAKMEGEE